MDDIDKAQDADATNLADAIERQRVLAALGPKLRPIGECWNPMCGEPFAANDNRLFCNAACADEHARRA
ncbi:DNA-directed RNA polymerase subunit alpha [Achromobacter phage Mano]|uniref:DNA-directed RNA polymerase subunit alpha n=1 Tax=Achromobacter phage Mano TaxID=2767570 RepID=A0A7L8G6S5_9CAUD|nr:DNA-directed RNA polymerase subunit alpha [Achromobacter phage Mano]QOE32762.1 DNA-directed RNA polymerase subunit alpha [Achromobacter phage Mano]